MMPLQLKLFESEKPKKNTLVAIQKKSENYKGLDKYYTKKDIVKYCLQELHFKDYDFVVEPSAGNGAFYFEIPYENKIGLDIAPENPAILKQNWFDYQIHPHYKNVLIVGNPPFGIKNSTSANFLKYAFRFENVKTIAFILPNVYNKHTRQKIIPKNWRIKNIVPLPKNSFIFEKREKHVPCSFFIFDKSEGEDLRFLPEKYKETKDFYFGTKHDFDIFVFGASPTKIINNPTKNNRGYFLKSKIKISDLIEKIKAVSWKGNSCANGGVFWLTKAELCYEYSKFHNKKTNNE